MLVDSYYLLNYSVIKELSNFPTVSNFGTISLSLFSSISFFELLNNRIGSFESNSSLEHVFILKAMLFFILFT